MKRQVRSVSASVRYNRLKATLTLQLRQYNDTASPSQPLDGRTPSGQRRLQGPLEGRANNQVYALGHVVGDHARQSRGLHFALFREGGVGDRVVVGDIVGRLGVTSDDDGAVRCHDDDKGGAILCSSRDY